MTDVADPNLADAHLARARRALAEGDDAAAIMWSSLCAEVAMDRVAAGNGIDARKDHFRRASVARRLFEMGVLPEDLGDLLIRLNAERKQAVYEGHAPDLRGRTWEQVLDSLAELVDIASRAAGPAE